MMQSPSQLIRIAPRWRLSADFASRIRPAHLIALLPLLLAAMLAPVARAQSTIDRVHRDNGVDSGKILKATPLGVTVSKGSVETVVPSEEIQFVSFGDEPAELAAVRRAMQTQRYDQVLEALAKVELPADAREELAAEVAYYGAEAQARQAVAGQGDAAHAVVAVRDFLAKHRASFHVPAMLESLGDLLAAQGKHADARVEYNKLSLAKNDYYALRAQWLAGRCWQAQGEHDKALAEFDKASAAAIHGSRAEQLKTSLTLDAAVSRAAQGKGDQSVQDIAALIAKAAPDDVDLLARAYNALGECYLAGGDKQGALFAFLHVDLLYRQSSQQHAQALRQLIPLWKAAGREDRSQAAAATLAEKYPRSR